MRGTFHGFLNSSSAAERWVWTAHVGLDARDFGLERFDAGLQLLDRDRVEVLFSELHQRIVGLAREEVFEVHGESLTVAAHVNKRRAVPSIPSSMRAVVAPQPDGAEELALVERRCPGRAGRSPDRGRGGRRQPARHPPAARALSAAAGAPDILGLEVAGQVVEAGEGAEELMGQSVCALVAGGGYAEYCVAPVGTCLPVPRRLSLVEAAAMPETLFTVWVNVFERGFAADGDWVLVHGGTSGIGTMAIALGRLFGLHVIVTCGTDEKCARRSHLGAEAAVNYRTGDFVEAALSLTDGKGVAVVLDMVGGDYVPRNLAALAIEGRHVSIAHQSGAKAEIASRS